MRHTGWLLALLLLVLPACGGGGGGGGISVTVSNETSDALLTRIEFLHEASGAVAAGADFALLGGQTWTGELPLPPGRYWRIVRGTDLGSGAPCVDDARDNAVEFGDPELFVTTVDADDRALIEIFRGLFCDGSGGDGF